MAERPTTVTGAAGEHLVAARLAGMGYIVALTRGGSPGVDLMVASEGGIRTLAVQVKTSSSAVRRRERRPDETFWEWPIGKDAAGLQSEHLWYAFVDLQGWPDSTNSPEVYLVPSVDVARQVRYECEHDWSRTFLRLGAAEGRDYPCREQYREKWNSLRDFLGQGDGSGSAAVEQGVGPADACAQLLNARSFHGHSDGKVP